MTLTHNYDGSSLGFQVPPTKVAMPSRAELGSISNGGVSPEDPAAALTLIGWKPYHIDETDCSQPRLFTGWVFDRNIGREVDQAEFVGPDARIHDTTITDLNAVFQMRIIWDVDGKRGEETMEDRLDWILTSDYLSGLIADTGFVHRGFTLMMDAADYRGDYPDAVFSDLSGRSATVINYFAFWDPTPTTGMQPALFYDFVGVATFDCTKSISNDLSDVFPGGVHSATIFAPDKVARLNRTPEQVWTDVIVEFANGWVHCYNPLTAAAYNIRRGTKISRPYTGKSSTAIAQGNNFLDAHSVETDRITTTIKEIPSTAVGLIQAGMRMPVKFTHMPGYESGATMRIVACTPRPVDDYAQWYDVDLELVAPKATIEPSCPATEVFGSPPAADSYGGSLAYTGGSGYHGPVPPFPLAPPADGSGTHTMVFTPSPATIIADYTPTEISFGTPDDGSPFGWFASVGGGGDVWGAWTFDLGTAASICLLSAAPCDVNSGDAFANVWSIDSSDDLATWNNEADSATILGSYINGLGTAVAVPLFPTAPHQYWRLKMVKTIPPGMYYIAGLSMGYIVLYPGTGPTGGDIIPGSLGTTVTGETPTPTPTGTTVTFTLASAYLPGSLQVSVDGLPVPASEVTETNPAAGTFTLSWAVDADEKVTATYRVG